MKTNVIKAILIISCLFVSITIKAQNPFITRADVIVQFDISPDRQWACCSWWGVDGISKIKIKKLNTQRVINIDSISLREGGPFFGVSFLSDSQLLYAKEDTLFSYNLKNHNRSKLSDLPNFMTQYLTVAKDRKEIYFYCNKFIYYADIKGGIKNKKSTNNLDVTEISATTNNQIIYSLSMIKKGKKVIQIWSWDGQNQSSNLTELFSKKIKAPYIVEATSDPNLYIVVGREGMFRFDKSTQKATKLIANSREDPVAEVRISNDNKTLYYKTNNQKKVIKTMDMDGKQGKSILF